MKIGFIGPGKVGVNLGRYFIQNNIEVTGYYGRTNKNTIEAVNITKSKLYKNIEELIEENDIIFITTPDDNISNIDIIISKYGLKNKSIIHTSGSLKSAVLMNSKLSGAYVYSLHPIYAFSSKNISIDKMKTINFSIEGENLSENSQVIKLLNLLGNKYFVRKEEDCAKYHLANVFVSNLVLSLLQIGTNYFKDLGLSERQGLDAIYPLVHGNIENIYEHGFVNSLTGPAVRGDVNTIKKHISVLKKEDSEIYKILSMNLINLALNKELSTESAKKNDVEKVNDLNEKYNEIYKLLGGLDK